MFGLIKERIKTIIEEKKSYSVEEAVRLALDIESDAAEYHVRDAINFLDPAVSKLVIALGKADDAHKEELMSFALKHDIIISREDSLGELPVE